MREGGSTCTGAAGHEGRATRTIWTRLISDDDEGSGDHEGRASRATSDEDDLDWTDLRRQASCERRDRSDLRDSGCWQLA